MFMNNKNAKKEAGKLLAARDEALRPVWVRAPKPGQVEYFSGLGRGKMYQAEALGLIKTASLKPPGAIRGVKLFHLESLLKYVESCTTATSNLISPHAAVPIDDHRVRGTRQTKSTASEKEK